MLHAGPSDTDFLVWLRATLADALRASLQHDSLKKVVRELRASIEGKFNLAAVQVGQPFGDCTCIGLPAHRNSESQWKCGADGLVWCPVGKSCVLVRRLEVSLQ